MKTVLRIVTSVPVLTLLILFGVEVLLRQVNVANAMGFRSADSWQITRKIKECKRTCPEVDLIGSSLLLPLNQDGSGAHFYTGIYPKGFERHLSKAAGVDVKCVNLCTGRQTVSEAYLIEKAVTDGACYPKVAIYGLIMRAFIDEEYAAEWKGESFNAVAPFAPADITSLLDLYSYEALREFALCHFLYIYRDRASIRNMLAAPTKDLLEYLPLDTHFVRMGPDFTYKRQRKGLLYEQLSAEKMEECMMRAHKKTPENVHKTFKDYFISVHAHRPKHAPKISNHYLKKLAELCQRKEIRLVVVNMPISKEFKELAPEGAYERFQKDLERASDQLSFFVIDISDDSDFTDKSFKDGLHLNYDGARLLARKLVDRLSADYPFILRTIKEAAGAKEK